METSAVGAAMIRGTFCIFYLISWGIFKNFYRQLDCCSPAMKCVALHSVTPEMFSAARPSGRWQSWKSPSISVWGSGRWSRSPGPPCSRCLALALLAWKIWATAATSTLSCKCFSRFQTLRASKCCLLYFVLSPRSDMASVIPIPLCTGTCLTLKRLLMKPQVTPLRTSKLKCECPLLLSRYTFVAHLLICRYSCIFCTDKYFIMHACVCVASSEYTLQPVRSDVCLISPE